MTLASLFAFNLALLAALLSPGPGMLYVVHGAVAGGFSTGAARGLGLGLMAAGWMGLALLGLEGLFTLVPWAWTVMKVAGALYLLWIAWQTWQGANRPLEARDDAVRRHVRGGILVNAANPKSVLFAGAVIVVIFPQGLGQLESALIVLNQFAVEVIFYTGVSALLGREVVARHYLGLKPVLDRTAAGLLGLLGLRMIADR